VKKQNNAVNVSCSTETEIESHQTPISWTI